MYGYLPPILQAIQVSQVRNIGNCWSSKHEPIKDVFLLTVRIKSTFFKAKSTSFPLSMLVEDFYAYFYTYIIGYPKCWNHEKSYRISTYMEAGKFPTRVLNPLGEH